VFSDPLTAALNVAYAALTLATQVWNATPAAQQQAAASDWASFTHNIGSFIVSLQSQINKSVGSK
jgi:hypothetical protein